MPVLFARDAEFATLTAPPRPVLVHFAAEWCGICRLFAPTYAALAGRHPEVRFVVVEAETCPGARRAARISALPFFALFQNGELAASTATATAEAVTELLSARSAPGSPPALVQFVSSSAVQLTASVQLARTQPLPELQAAAAVLLAAHEPGRAATDAVACQRLTQVLVAQELLRYQHAHGASLAAARRAFAARVRACLDAG